MNMTDEEVEALATPNEPKLSMNYFGVGETDLRWSGVILGFVFIGYAGYGRFGTLAMMGLGAITMLRLPNGRLYSMAWHVVRSVWITHARKGVVWQSVPLHTEQRRGSRIRGALLQGSPPIPLEVNAVGDKGQIGILHRPESGTDSLVITGEGSNISSLSLKAQFAAQRRLAEAIKRVASLQGFAVGVSWVFRRCPPNMQDVSNFARENLHPDAALPEGLITAEEELTPEDLRWLRLHRNFEQVADLVRFLGTDVMAAVATIRRQGALSEAVKGKALDPNALGRLSLNKIARTAEHELAACGVDKPTTLDMLGMHGYLRRIWDVVTLPAYHRWEATNPTVDELLDPEYERLWPQREILAYHDHLVMDGTYHSVIRLTTRPPESLPSFFSQIFAIEAQYLTVTLVGEVARSGNEVRVIDWGNAMKEEFDNQRGVGYKRKQVEAREQARKSRHQRIFVSRFGQRFSVLMAVSSATREGLEDDVDKVLSKLSLMGMTGKRTKYASLQLPALLTTTGVNML